MSTFAEYSLGNGRNEIVAAPAVTPAHSPYHEPGTAILEVDAEPRSVACLIPQPTAEEWDEDTLEELAARIQEAHLAVSRASEAVVAFARRAGQLLLKARDRVPPGSWQAWLEANCDFSVRTAQVYMRVAREFNEGRVDAQTQHAARSLRRMLLALPKTHGSSEEAQEATSHPWADCPVELVPHLFSWHKTRRRFVAQTKRLSELGLAHAHPESREVIRRLICETMAAIWSYGPGMRSRAAQPVAAAPGRSARNALARALSRRAENRPVPAGRSVVG